MHLLLNNELLIKCPNIFPEFAIDTIVYINDDYKCEYKVCGIDITQFSLEGVVSTQIKYTLVNEDDGGCIIVDESEIISFLPSTNEYSIEFYKPYDIIEEEIKMGEEDE